MPNNSKVRDGWTRVRFGDIAEQINDRVDDPNAAGVDHYVGLEHLDPGSLRVTRWGSPDEVSAQKLRFQRGDIIFGKRRAYQRKVAGADFEGIWSAHAMVLRERPEALATGFLIHFMASDVFMERAIQISVGSLSPTINWSTLRDQEFDLPPTEEQLRQVARLDAIRNAREAYAHAATIGAEVRASLGQTCEMSTRDFPHLRIGELVESMQYGVSCRPETHGSIPILRMGNLHDGTLDTTDLKYTELSEINGDRDFLNVGDVLFNRTNSLELVGKAALFELEGSWAFASYLVRLVPRRELVVPEFLVAVINSPPVRARILANATKGVSQANVNTKNLANVKARIPPLSVQQRIVEVLRHVRHAEEHLRERARSIPKTGTLLELETA